MARRLGLVLTGGGARAAYQAGVLKAMAEWLPHRAHNPFPVICGSSAGALNAATLAINARHFHQGVQYLLEVWKNFRVSDVYRTDAPGVFANSVRWFAGLLLSGFGIRLGTRESLLDNRPTARLLEQILPCEKIQASIDAGMLHALAITASGYASGESVTFYQGVPEIAPWKRARRIGLPTQIGLKHLLASTAIPFLFPPVRVNREYFGDGSMRQIAPISAALHTGATRVLVIGIRHAPEQPRQNQISEYPSLAQVAGHALDTIFLDALEVDLERIQRINRTLELIPEERRKEADLQHVDVLVIAPSVSIAQIAEQHAGRLPWTIRLLLRLIGAMRRGGSNLVSYLLFDKAFCRALIDLGYQDATQRKAEILAFLDASDEQPAPGFPQ
ncbi:MAG: patatin-like phospholipase family protein [Pseudomonadota bacterium]